ncbi:twin-arginine translocase TatA/TatE family subunit [Deltaproteobacteria bacterium Smac51]|nr:twin-arginine translocase TatA/TatE family subunit [Deltaproteobacteria bacterium Smac51]
MGSIGIWELLVILIIALLIFGGRKMPELGRSLGLGLSNFRKAVKGEPDNDEPSAKPGTKG